MTDANRKIALVTGGSRGLGRAMAQALADAGRDVILTYHSQEDEAAEVVSAVEERGGRATALQLDAMEDGTFDAFADRVKQVLGERWGRDQFDFLINNAGFGVYAPFADTTREQFDQLVAVHLKGPFFLTQTLLPLLADGGRIVNVSSGLTRFTFPGYAAYATMKGGVEVMTSYLAKELGERDISAVCLAPGAIETDFGGGAVRDDQDLNDMIAAQTALGRVGLPEDIGGVVAALLDDGARWINGQRVEASGGMFL
jgi:NAD(P)-dependent dehydrogenase (short-subunit alcohol dehydrogenase family)